MNPTDSELRRFWSKVALPDENGCMLWMASCFKDGQQTIGKIVNGERWSHLKQEAGA